MWKILQQEQPEDFVLATGVTTTIRRFCEMAFAEVGMEIIWQGSGLEEKGIDKATGRTVVAVDPRYFRPAEVDLLLGDPRKAQEKLGWKPKYDLPTLVREMMKADLEEAQKEFFLRSQGYHIVIPQE